MYCRRCGTEIPDDSIFCVKCGTPVEGAAEQPKKEEQAPIRTEAASPVYTPPKKKKKTGLVIACVAVVLVLILVGLYFFVLKGTRGGFGKRQVSILEDKEKLAEITSSVLKIECYDDEKNVFTTGSGFIAFSDDIVVTNFHVIEDHPYGIRALSEDGRQFEIDGIITYNQEMDIAILKTKGGTGRAPLAFAENEVEKTDKVVAIGSPLGLMNTVSDGIVSGFTQIGNESVIQFTASISHGSSGGVLLNEAGEVVGVTFASFSAGQNLNVAIPVKYVSELYAHEANSPLTTILTFYNEVDHTKTYSTEEVRKNLKKHNNEEMNVYGYLFVRKGMFDVSMYLVDNSDVLYELVAINDAEVIFYEKILKIGESPTSEERRAMSQNGIKAARLIESDAVLKLKLDSYSLPSQFRSGSNVIAHGKIDSEGVFVVDAVDYYN